MFALRSIALIAGIASMTLANPVAQGNGDGCTICVDMVNECGKMYGGCYNKCTGPIPAFAKPPCNCDVLPEGRHEFKDLTCECMTKICPGGDDQTYGGCYPPQGPIPGWAEPQCAPFAVPKKF